MMSLESIEQLSREQGQKAAKLKKQPLVAFEDGDIDCHGIPNIGSYRPKGWKLIQRHFVDSSGWGSPGEPALTLEQFLSKVKAGLGYAIVEAGQFQIYVGEFEKVG